MPYTSAGPLAFRRRRQQGLGVLVVGIALVLISGRAWAAKQSPAIGGSDDCGWRVTRDYGPDSLTYRLHLDLGGCAWWNGADRRLEVTVRRTDNDGTTMARSAPSPCQRSGQSQTPRAAGCDASVTIDHPEGETARYAGQAAWIWNDGRREVAFAATCTTTSETVSCTDEARPTR